MRELIRPALFLVARIGLLLSVIVYGVGKQRVVELLTPFGHVEASRFGIKWFGAPFERWKISSRTTRELSATEKVDLAVLFGQLPPTVPGRRMVFDSSKPVMELRFVRFGISLATDTKWFQTGQVIAIRHWLIVTTFALVYGMLKWVYRKRAVAEE